MGALSSSLRVQEARTQTAITSVKTIREVIAEAIAEAVTEAIAEEMRKGRTDIANKK
jgi:hypothetical protein